MKHSRQKPSRETFLHTFVSPAPTTVGTALSQDEVDLYKRARDAMWPVARIATYDDFSKWLFTIVAVIGTLGAAFSSTAFKVMTPLGAVIFGFAMLLASIALAASVLSRASDFPPDVNWMSQEAVSAASKVMLQKRSLVWVAGLCFATSLLCASAAPLVSLFAPSSRQGTLAVVSAKDGIHVDVVLASRENGVGELTIIGIQGRTETVFSYQRATSDISGSVRLTGNTPLLGGTFTALRLVISCGPALSRDQEVTLPIVQSGIAATSEQFHQALASGACVGGS